MVLSPDPCRRARGEGQSRKKLGCLPEDDRSARRAQDGPGTDENRLKTTAVQKRRNALHALHSVFLAKCKNSSKVPSQINWTPDAYRPLQETLLPGWIAIIQHNYPKSLLRVLKINGRPRTLSSLLKSPPPLLILGPKPRLPVRRSGCPVILPGLWFYLARARRAAASTRLHTKKKYSSNRGPGRLPYFFFKRGCPVILTTRCTTW